MRNEIGITMKELFKRYIREEYGITKKKISFVIDSKKIDREDTRKIEEIFNNLETPRIIAIETKRIKNIYINDGLILIAYPWILGRKLYKFF